jgi:hypothetical protein
MKYLVTWEDQKSGIGYVEPFSSSAPLLEVADLFKRQKESAYPSLSVKVKVIAVMPEAQ